MCASSPKNVSVCRSSVARAALVLAAVLFAGGCRSAAPEAGTEFRVAVTAGAAESGGHTVKSLRTRLDLAGWPWFNVERSGPTEATVRVGTLDADRREALTRLLSVPLRLEGFVSDLPPSGPAPRPDVQPTFTSDDVEHAHLEAPRSGTRVHIKLGGEAARRLEAATRAQLGGSLSVFVDGEWLMAAGINEPLRGGLVRLTLPGDTAEQRHLVSMELVVGLRGPLMPGTAILGEAPWPADGS